MKYVKLGFGLYGWEGDDIGIAGGNRDHGFHPEGQVRAIFHVYAVPSGVSKSVEVAKLVLLIDLAKEEGEAPTVSALINIEVDRKFRGQGFGRRTVECLREIATDDLRIFDIKKSATGFWRALGAERFEKECKYTNALIPKRRPADEIDVSQVEPLRRAL